LAGAGRLAELEVARLIDGGEPRQVGGAEFPLADTSQAYRRTGQARPRKVVLGVVEAG
jgi:hypothetical protein